MKRNVNWEHEIRTLLGNLVDEIVNVVRDAIEEAVEEALDEADSEPIEEKAAEVDIWANSVLGQMVNLEKAKETMEAWQSQIPDFGPIEIVYRDEA